MTDFDEKLAVICVDGGICSQIAFYAIGLELKRIYGDDIHVKFDLSWFDRFGCDNNGRFVRNWDFTKAFPTLPVIEADRTECERLRRGFEIKNCHSLESLLLPCILTGYPERMRQIAILGCTRIKNDFLPALDAQSQRFLTPMPSMRRCGVHVRRGDLAFGNAGHGPQTSIGYYLTAIAVLRGLDEDIEIVFFSDEPDWVEKELMPKIPHQCMAYLFRGHGSDAGYLDLFCLSRCDYVIASVGSFGHYAAMLSPCVRRLIVPRCLPEVFAGFERCIYINDDREFERQRHERELADRVAAEKTMSPCRIAYAFHLFGCWFRRVIGLISADEYRWNALRLKRRFSV